MDPFNLKASLRALAASKRQEPVSVPEEEKNPVRKLGSKIQADIVKEAPPGLLERAGGTALSGLATVGNLLDVPGSMVRDTLSWLPGGPKPQNPFDQLASPFTHENRLTGRDLMRGYGLAGKEDTMLNFLTGLGAEIALDPLSYLTFGASAMTKGGKAARALNLENRAIDTASKALGRKVGKREARHVVTPRMLIEDASNDIRRFDEKELTERFKDFGVDEARLDRPLGGLAKISIPFTDRPFTWNKKPVTFWGLTDEEGIIGVGRIRGRGEPPVDKIKIPDTPPNDKGPSISPSGTGPAGPDVDGPTPPPSGPSPGPSGPAPTTGGPMNPAGGPDLEGPTRNEPVIDPPTPKGGGPIEPIAKITPRGDELDIDIDAGPTGSAKAVVAYSSDAAEDPAILISSFSRMPEASVGTGRAIINKIVEVAKDKNPSSISGKFDNSQALGAFLSVFGKDNVTFYDRATGNPLDISFAEALKSPQSYIATHEFKKPVAETIQEAAPTVDDISPPASTVNEIAPAPELPPATIQPELKGFEPEVVTTPAVAESLPQSTLPPATVQPTLAGFEPEVIKAAKRGRKAKQKPVTEAEAKDAYNTTIAANEIRDEAKAIAEQAARQDAIARWRSKYPTSSKEYLASGDLSKSDYEKALTTGVAPQTLKQIIDDGITEGAFSKEQGDNLKSIIDQNTAKPSVAETPAAFNTQPTANVQRGLANFEPEVVKVAKRDRRAKEKPVAEAAPVIEQAITAARTVDDALDPARVANAEKTKTANEFVRRLGGIQVDGRPKYGPKELEIVRSVALGNVDGAVSQFKNYKERGLDLELNFSKLGERAKNEKFITEAQLAEYQSKMRDAITDVYLKNYDIMRDTPASIGSRAGVDVWSTLDPNIRSMFSGNKQFGDAMTKRAGFLRDQANKQAQAAAKAAEDAAKKGKLKSEVGAAAGDGLAPRMVNLKSLEGLPEEAKPIVGEMLTKIGQKLFDDVKLQVGGDGAKATVAGDIDMNTGFINIYNAAIKNKTVDKTTIHELWHHLSKYVSPDEVRSVRNEFESAVAAFKKSEGNKALPYELSSVDEFFAHKVTDLSMKYLGREKPVDLIGKVWTKALEAFEYIWDAIRQTLGYDQTKKIMSSFLNGHRSEISKYTDATMTQRLMDELEPSEIRETRGLLQSEYDQTLTSPEIAEQLSKFRSAKIAKGMDQIGERILDTAPARQLTALFDQSVLGQLTKAGQEIARMAFTAYRESVLRERKFMSDHVRTWYDTPNIREDVIIQEELPSLANYTTAANGDKKLAAKRQLVDARKIQNERVNDIRRIMERSIFDSEGKVRPNAHVVTPEMLPAWVGREKIDGRIIENPERRIQLSRMLTAFRQKIANMIRDEHGAGVNTSWLDGYYPRISPNLPGSNFSLWNPNYGKILDPTHPSQKRRKDFFVGYSDGTSVVNDISVDPDFSGVHARKKVREDLQDKEVYEYAKKLWNKYRDRLFPDKISMSFEQMLATDKIAGKKITELTRAVMELDPRHAEFQIPMFSNDLFSAFELRLEHHHRSIMQANVIRNLIKRDIAPRDLLESKKAVTLDKVLRESKYDNQKAIPLVMNSIPGSVMLQVDQRFWAKEIQNRVDKAKQLYDEAMRQIEQGVASPSTAYVDPGGKSATFDPSNSTIRIKNFFDSGKEDSDLYDLTIRVNFRDPNKSVAELVRWTVVDDEIIETPPVVLRNPLNLTPDQVGKYYKSDLPPKYLLNELVIPDDIASAVTKFVKGPRVLEEMGPIVRGYDKATNMWKMMQTGMMPFISFHGRNLGSGQASNFYLGIQNDPRFQEFNFADPKTWLNPIRKFTAPIADAHRLQTGQEIKDISKAPAFKGLGYTDEQATERLRRMAYAQGITGEKQGLSAEQLMDTVGTAASQYPGLDPKRGVNPLAWKWSEAAPESTFAQRWLMPWMSKGVLSDADVFRPGQLGRDLGSYTEGLNRLAPFIAMIRQGYDPRAAANAINRAQVDYTNLSNFNREYTRRLFPFATYTLGMAPTVFGELMQRPGGGMARTIMTTTQAGQTDEQGVTPDYIRETASIPLGVSDDGTRSYITGFGLPFEDPLQFAQAARGNVSGLLREVGSRMNPIPKSLIETMTGRSLYQAGPFGGREIEDLDPTIGRIAANVSDLITGEKTERAQPFISPWTEYAISNAGPGRMLNTIRTATDPRKWDVIPWKLLLNLGTGVRVADVSPSAQDAILRERLARIMKDFGGRMYTRPYFPDYAKEDWSPEEARDALEIDALMKLLNKRASDRKKMEE